MTYILGFLALTVIVIAVLIVAGMDIATKDHEDIKPRK